MDRGGQAVGEHRRGDCAGEAEDHLDLLQHEADQQARADDADGEREPPRGGRAACRRDSGGVSLNARGSAGLRCFRVRGFERRRCAQVTFGRRAEEQLVERAARREVEARVGEADREAKSEPHEAHGRRVDRREVEQHVALPQEGRGVRRHAPEGGARGRRARAARARARRGGAPAAPPRSESTRRRL